MDRNTYYTFKEVCNEIFWLSPATIRVYLSTNRISVPSLFDENTGRRLFSIADVKQYVEDNKPNNATMRRRKLKKA